MPDVPPIPDGSAIITPNMQYAELQELRKSVDRLVATVDPAFEDIRKDVFELDKKFASQQAQIDVNTQWRNRIVGALLLLSALVGWGAINFIKLAGG